MSTPMFVEPRFMRPFIDLGIEKQSPGLVIVGYSMDDEFVEELWDEDKWMIMTPDWYIARMGLMLEDVKAAGVGEGGDGQTPEETAG